MCAKCGESKNHLQFRVRCKVNNWLDCYCIPCRSQYFKEYYGKRRDKYRVMVNATKEQRKKIRYDAVNAIKRKPCMDCGGTFPEICMDFDHRSDKILPISRMITLCRSMERILKEIEKCDLVCSNCHRIRTAQRWKVIPRGRPVPQAAL